MKDLNDGLSEVGCGFKKFITYEQFLSREKPANGVFIDMRGAVIELLTVKSFEGQDTKRRSMWRCLCKCGKETVVDANHLRRKKIKSCGCLRHISHSVTHGKTNTLEFSSWMSMRARCLCRTNKKYPSYGGRGIKICDRWMESFESFLEDMGERPVRTTLHRIDNNGNYEPANCVWADDEIQANEKRNVPKYEWKGAALTLSQIAKMEGNNPDLARSRIKQLGWSIEDAVLIPSNGCRRGRNPHQAVHKKWGESL